MIDNLSKENAPTASIPTSQRNAPKINERNNLYSNIKNIYKNPENLNTIDTQKIESNINNIDNNNNKNNKQKSAITEIEKSEANNFEIFNFNKNITETQKTNIIVRLSLITCGFVIWLLYRYTLQSSDNKWDFIYCFEDRLLTSIFLPITNAISQNLYIRDLLLIASSAFLDVFMICFICVYISKGNSWAPLLHMGFFYGFRGAVVQNLVIMQIYDTYIFEYPGFPSLVVPYFRAADFFYSGHSGCALLLGLQMADMGYSELKYVGFLLGIFEGLVLTMLRIHYSIDIIFGLIASHYLYFVTKEIAKYADKIFPMGAPDVANARNFNKKIDKNIGMMLDDGERKDDNKFEEEHNTSFLDGLENVKDKRENINLKSVNRTDSSYALNNNQMDEVIGNRRN